MMNGNVRPDFWGYRITAAVVGGLVLALLLAFVFGLFVKLLWNGLMPAVFGLGPITYWQGFGLVLLARMLFGGWGRSPRRLPRGVTFHGAGAPIDVGVHGAGRGARRRRARYRDWWQEEGRAAFEAYAARKEGSDGETREGGRTEKG